jgi:hypothetical protein
MGATWIWLVAVVMGAMLLAFALTRSARGQAPESRSPEGALERFWDTQEHSDAWEEERDR